MDERNIKGVIICVIMLIGLVFAMFFITKNDEKRVSSIDTSEAEKIIEERKKEDGSSEEEGQKDQEEIEIEKEKELTTFKSFELSYTRSEEPFSSYYIKVDEERNLTSNVDEKCSNNDDCYPSKEQNTLRLSDQEYKLVIDLYNKLYTEEWPSNTKESYIVIVSRLAKGDEKMYSSETNCWELFEKYDRDDDGKVLYREYGEYALEVFAY